MAGVPDYNLLAPEDLDRLLFSPFEQALGKETRERIRQQLANYDYYDGKQHVDPETGRLVKASELPRPPGFDYDPTRYETNYFKAFIKRKARWQMGGKHGIVVTPKQIDDPLEMAKPDYKPSEAQRRENERAEKYEKLLYQLWKENKMHEKLLAAARDRLIAGRVGCKIVFNPNTGKIKWVFRPDYEIIPVYSDDDYEELLAIHFVRFYEDEDTGESLIRKQTFSMENGECFLEEAIYNYNLQVVKWITRKQSMGLDFIPVVLFPIVDLSDESVDYSEVTDMKDQTDILNKLNEDAIDSLRFEMFPMTAFFNVPEGTVDKTAIAPGASIELRGAQDGVLPDIKKIESSFRWKEAFQDQYARVKAALHEITSLPQIVPQELNFGGLNGEALQVLFHDIILETEEHWLTWGPRLQELHEKTIRYLQARLDSPVFGYDRDVVRMIGNDYDNEIKFVLPLPDNRKELVELLMLETEAGFESKTGAMQRLGVENVNAKKQEIENEAKKSRETRDPYNEFSGGDDES